GEAGRQLPIVGMMHVGLAEVLCARNELEAATDHVTQGIALCRQIAYTRPLATGLGVLAWIRQAQGDTAGASDAISQAERVEPSPKVVTLFNPVPVWRGGGGGPPPPGAAPPPPAAGGGGGGGGRGRRGRGGARP